MAIPNTEKAAGVALQVNRTALPGLECDPLAEHLFAQHVQGNGGGGGTAVQLYCLLPINLQHLLLKHYSFMSPVEKYVVWWWWWFF